MSFNTYSIGMGRGIAPLPIGKMAKPIMDRINMIADLDKRRVEANTVRNKRTRRRLLKQLVKEYRAHNMPTMAQEIADAI